MAAVDHGTIETWIDWRGTMVTMTEQASVLTLPRSRPLTYEDLAVTPDDGRRYELVDGTLLVSPSPIHRHQAMLGKLFALLDATAPSDVAVMLGPFDFVPAPTT